MKQIIQTIICSLFCVIRNNEFNNKTKRENNDVNVLDQDCCCVGQTFELPVETNLFLLCLFDILLVFLWFYWFFSFCFPLAFLLVFHLDFHLIFFFIFSWFCHGLSRDFLVGFCCFPPPGFKLVFSWVSLLLGFSWVLNMDDVAC